QEEASTSTQLAHYLKVAVKSGEKLDTLVNVVKKLDTKVTASVLSTASNLNKIDVNNFLTGTLQAPEGQIENLIQLTNTLSSHDRSLFLYAAAQTRSDESDLAFDALITNAQELEGEERSQYLLNQANADNENAPDPWIHLQEDFSSHEIGYIDFATRNLTGEYLDEFMLQMDDLTSDERTLYLRTAAYAGDKLTDMIDLFGPLSRSERSALLSLSGTLSRHDIPDYISASVNAKDDIEGFVDQVNSLHDREPIHLIRATANAGDRTNDLLSLVDNLSGANRQAFLLSAAYAGSYVGDLVDIANNFIEEER
ncbi:MAG: hypothetical protein GY850_28200, partial [bacterium]|nr:hypothetical protein [bacterium]